MSRRKKYTGYIYLITNLVNGKKYVGQTYDRGGYKVRWGTHKKELRKGLHYNEHLQSAWNKYGESNFKFEVLHKLQFSNKDTLLEALDDLEIMYIAIWNLNDHDFGYNIREGGGNTPLNDYIKRKIGKAHAKKLAQYTLDGQFIRTWESAMEVSRELGFDNSSINACCNGYVSKSYGYRWTYVEGDKITTTLQPLKYEPNRLSRRIAMIDKNTDEVLRTFNSVREANEYFNRAKYDDSISQCARGKTNTSLGYKWKYLDEDNLTYKYKITKPVAMINKDTDEVIKVFNSVVDANEYLGKPRDRDNIGACARGETKTAYGYKWKYITQEQIQEEIDKYMEEAI